MHNNEKIVNLFIMHDNKKNHEMIIFLSNASMHLLL